MGANVFFQRGKGKTAREAFSRAHDDAAWEHGHGGYSGTLAEKHEFTMISAPEGVDPMKFANQLIDDSDQRIDDKWGPAGCIQLTKEADADGNFAYLFFGWASS